MNKMLNKFSSLFRTVNQNRKLSNIGHNSDKFPNYIKYAYLNGMVPLVPFVYGGYAADFVDLLPNNDSKNKTLDILNFAFSTVAFGTITIILYPIILPALVLHDENKVMILPVKKQKE